MSMPQPAGLPPWEQICAYFPERLRMACLALPASQVQDAEEIRLRTGQPIAVTRGGRPYLLTAGGLSLFPGPGQPGIRVTAGELSTCLRALTRASLFAVEDQLLQGFLTLPGGHRVGIGGMFFLDRDGRAGVRHISSLNLRLHRPLPGAAGAVLPFLWPDPGHRPFSALILSPPGAGKTTLLRELARRLSYGDPAAGRVPLRVGIVDERGEISGPADGVPTFDLGPHSDVVLGLPKGRAFLHLLRSLAPDVVVLDELGQAQEEEVLEQAAASGVSLLASAHAATAAEARCRPGLRRLLSGGAFQRLVILDSLDGPGSLAAVLDGEDRVLYLRPGSQGRKPFAEPPLRQSGRNLR
ncbi:MAG: stage III sporulation protein AA [Firmicutes bacterium]|nr:stage III sporulation protein AA [Bacillota bacterium]